MPPFSFSARKNPCIICRQQLQITWILKDANGVEIDYAHFGPPFLLNVDEVYKKIRNLTLRTLGGEISLSQRNHQFYDWVIREALHNCIAHQDYPQGGRINVVEEDDSLFFTNLGSFIPGTVEKVIARDAPEETYRNRLLAEAMVNLNMIDTIGSGIKRMFRKQKERFLPMPDSTSPTRSASRCGSSARSSMSGLHDC